MSAPARAAGAEGVGASLRVTKRAASAGQRMASGLRGSGLTLPSAAAAGAPRQPQRMPCPRRRHVQQPAALVHVALADQLLHEAVEIALLPRTDRGHGRDEQIARGTNARADRASAAGGALCRASGARAPAPARDRTAAPWRGEWSSPAPGSAPARGALCRPASSAGRSSGPRHSARAARSASAAKKARASSSSGTGVGIARPEAQPGALEPVATGSAARPASAAPSTARTRARRGRSSGSQRPRRS